MGPCALMAQFEPVLTNGEVLFKLEIALPDGSTELGEITVAEPIVVNGRFYRKVFFRYGTGGDSVIGYLREDTASGELWFLLESDQSEVKVQDLTLEPGDEITVPGSWCGPGSDATAQVVSAGIINDRWTVTFDRTFGDGDAFCETLQYIEGVGPNATIFYPYFAPTAELPGTAYRLCRMRRNGALIYPSPDATVDDCDLATPAEEAPRQNRLRAYPNPASETLTLDRLPADAGFWILADAGGRIVAQQPIAGDMAQLAVGALPRGLYWLLVRGRDGRLLDRAAVVLE